MKIFNKIEESLKNKLPFVVYKVPEREVVSAFFQKNDDLFFVENYSEKGFVFAPFDDKEKSILITDEYSDFFEEKVFFNYEEIQFKKYFISSENDKKYHISIVEKAIKSIENDELKKVVLSRKETFEVKEFNVVEGFKKLLSIYKKSMVYVWFHPKVGLWFGATPEKLFSLYENKLQTVSLAGTQFNKENIEVEWNSKELDEQNIVTKTIISDLKQICNNVEISNLETIKTGNLLHLKTNISGILNEKFNVKDVIENLHPTPAICGFPKKEAKSLINKLENYNRKFYTGFLGELNLGLENKYSNLYVNIRCAELQNNNINIYVGGGIMKDSNSEKEWNETEIKTQIIKSIL